MSLDPALFLSEFDSVPDEELLRPVCWNDLVNHLNAILGTPGETGAPLYRDAASPHGVAWAPSALGVFACGGAGQAPVFRALQASDIPALSYDPLGAAAAVTPTTLGLVIGTNVQAHGATLDAVQALASSVGWLHNDGAGALAYSTPTAANVGAEPAFALRGVALSTYKPAANDGFNLFLGANTGNQTMGGGAANSASYNVGIGTDVLSHNTLGAKNLALGFQAMQDNTTGSTCVAIGYFALQKNTTGTFNTACGLAALNFNTTGQGNAAFGDEALWKNISGDYNTAVGGEEPLWSNTTGSYNTAVGTQALFSNTIAHFNAAVGADALLTNTTGAHNTAVGTFAGYTNNGSDNVFLGYQAGYNQTALANGFIIDNQNRTSAALELTSALLVGHFDAAPANQTLRVNAALSVLDLAPITSYGGVTTAGHGLVVVKAFGRLTAQTGAILSLATCTPTVDGTFEVSANVRVVTSTTYSFSVICAYTDEENVARSFALEFGMIGDPRPLFSVIANTTGNGAAPYHGSVMHIRAKAGTAITISTTGTFTTVVYNAEAAIRRIA
jgi:hypothetical protein